MGELQDYVDGSWATRGELPGTFDTEFGRVGIGASTKKGQVSRSTALGQHGRGMLFCCGQVTKYEGQLNLAENSRWILTNQHPVDGCVGPGMGRLEVPIQRWRF